MMSARDCSPPEFSPRFSSQGDIDRLGVAFCANPTESSIVHAVQQYRMFRMRCLSTTLRLVESAQLPQRCLVSARLKRLDSIRQKIMRDNFQFKLGQIDDIVGVRIICSSLQEALSMSERVQNTLEFQKCRNYLYTPHPEGVGYRAVHHTMRFSQMLTKDTVLPVRFEIQVRSFLQHLWTVWSESRSEQAKAGRASKEIRSELQNLSERIAKWEQSNLDAPQGRLVPYTNAKNIIVSWRQKKTPPLLKQFRENTDKAVRYLNSLETEYPEERGNALLLVGVSDPSEAKKVLAQTHPLYISRVIAPEFWLPPDA